MTLNSRMFLYAALGCGLVFIPQAGIQAQQTSTPATGTQAQPGAGQEVDPLKRPRSDKEQFEAQKAVKQELKGAYKTWLTQDVTYIITDEEGRAFKNLSNDEERDAFIEQFWLRRNPNPDSPDNEFREEHYRRIAYANEHFAAGKPGWKTEGSAWSQVMKVFPSVEFTGTEVTFTTAAGPVTDGIPPGE